MKSVAVVTVSAVRGKRVRKTPWSTGLGQRLPTKSLDILGTILMKCCSNLPGMVLEQ